MRDDDPRHERARRAAPVGRPGTNGAAVCVGKDGETRQIGFTGASVQSWPRPEVWLPARSVALTYGWCGLLYSYNLVFPTQEMYDRWQDCQSRDTWVY